MVVLLGLLTSIAFAEQRGDVPTKRVLLISTGSRLSPGFRVVDREILRVLRTIETVRIETYAENLDIVRFPTERHQRIFREYLAARYAEQRPDIVILTFVGNLGLTASSLTQLFPGTPILVAGFTEEEIQPEQLGAFVTGFVERADARGALDLILRVQPGLRRIVVIGGTSLGDRQKLQPVRAAAPAFKNRVTVDFWDNLAMADLRRAVTALPRDTAILYTPLFRDAAGQTFVSAEVGRWIGQSASVPVYLMIDQSFGTGAMGGMISTVDAFGRRAGEQARRLLTGTSPAAMPFERRSDSVPTFDWRALERWNIGESALPAGSVIRFKPPSLWREYGWYIGGAVIVIVLQSATILALVFERRYRRRIAAEGERTELELQQQRRELAHVGRVSLMGELAASLAHELSQPLTAIFANGSAALQFLDRGDSGESREALKDLLKDQTRAAEVIRHMRRFVRKETAVEHTAVQIAEVIREVVALVRSDAMLQRVDVLSNADTSLPTVSANRVQLQQVLLNLVLNAIDAMAGVEGARIVTIAARGRDGVIHVAVSDRGHGVSLDDFERIFEPFYTTKQHGLGMGLSVCRAIIRAHGGSLWAENNDYGGATFNFTVPVAKA
jgi:signal transduction histidine kinase